MLLKIKRNMFTKKFYYVKSVKINKLNRYNPKSMTALLPKDTIDCYLPWLPESATATPKTRPAAAAGRRRGRGADQQQKLLQQQQGGQPAAEKIFWRRRWRLARRTAFSQRPTRRDQPRRHWQQKQQL